MGLSLIPASLAVVMRCFVPESPRYTLYVLNHSFRALQEADILNQSNMRHKYQQQYADLAIRRFRPDDQQNLGPPTQRLEFEFHDPVRRRRNAITLSKFWRYLGRAGNARKLAVTSSVWFLLDFVSHRYSLQLLTLAKFSLDAPQMSHGDPGYATLSA